MRSKAVVSASTRTRTVGAGPSGVGADPPVARATSRSTQASSLSTATTSPPERNHMA